MRNYVIINGVNSLTIQGLAINNLPPITKPMIRTQREEIDGRDGDIVTELGYSAYDKQIEIGLWGNYDINDIIKYFTGEGTIVFSNEEDKYYNFKILDQIDYEKLLKFKTATITFHCQPFKYPLEETPIEREATTLTGTGESITLNNTEEAPMKIDLKGNTSQNTTTGKNLFDKSNAQLNVGINTSNGDTYNDTSLFSTDYIPIEVNVSYVANSASTTGNRVFGACYDSNKSYLTAVSTGVGGRTFTVTNADAKYIRITGQQINIDNYQLEKGSTATAYEEYTGGVASPNPDYPQDIHVVSGDNSIKVEGRNLLNANFDTNTSNGITQNSNIYSINLPVENKFDDSTTTNILIADDGTEQTNSSIKTSIYIKVEPNTIYTCSSKLLPDKTSGWLKFSYYDASENYLSYLYTDNTIKTITTPNNCEYIRIGYHTSIVNDVQFEAGSKANSYTPFGTTPIELCKIGDYQDSIKKSTGKNLCNTTFELGGIDTTTGQNGSGTDRVRTKDYVEVKPNTTYTLSGVQGSRVVCFYNSSKAYLSYEVVGSQSTSGTFITPNDTSYIRWYIIQTNTNINEMLNEGTTALPYEPYGKDWYLNKQIGKLVLNGSDDEIWSYLNDYDNNYLYQALGISVDIENYSTNYLCSHALPNSTTSSSSNIGSYVFNKTFRLRVPSSIATTTGSFKTWLSTHNTIVYYVLATPTYTEITDSTLISQLEALEQAQSKDNQTNINQANNDLPFELDVSVTFVIPMEINNIGNIYAKPILTIEGTGNIGVILNDIQILEIDLTNNEKIAIDVPKLEAYNPDDDTLLNRLVTGDYMKLLINEGENTIKFTGSVSSATLTNYIRWI